MENAIKVKGIKENLTQEGLYEGESAYTFIVQGSLKGLPASKVREAIEKALNKVKPLDIPTL